MATIGIDLGTTNSLVSVYKDGKIVIIPNANGKNLTPSVVSLDGDTALVGDSAKERLITFPDSTASCFKRTMGQEFFYQLNNQTFSSVELSSLVLKNLKRDAEQFLGEEVKEAVISVPAYFNQFQRKATKDAAEIAGLKVERLISEPTAAALAYGVQNREDMNTILVFDLGGGTFDISLLELFDGVIDVKAVSGDNKLGGEDFTRSIAAWYISENNIDVKSISTEDMSKIIKTAEIAKRNISTPDSSLVQMSLNIGGKDYNSVLTQDTFKQITSDLMQRLVNPIKKVLQDQALERDEVDMVILMGGSTKMPIVQEFVKNLFGSDKVVSSYNPDETVALGAGILAAMKDNNQNFKETVLTDICSFSLGVAVHNDFSSFESKSEFSPIIERNSPIPISIVKQYFGSYQGQAQVLVKIYQGESLNLDEDIFLGEIEVPLPTDKIPKVDIRFTYDINSLLEVEVTNANNEKKSIVLNNSSSGMTEEEKKAAQKNMEKLKIVPWEQEENRALLEKGKRLYSETVGEKRETVKQVLDAFMKVLSSQNPIEIKKAYKSTKQIFDSLESEW